MSTATAGPRAAISEESRRRLVQMAWASSLIISSLVMLVVGFIIGKAASNRITKRTRGIT